MSCNIYLNCTPGNLPWINCDEFLEGLLNRQNIDSRIRRIEGQVRGIGKMIESGAEGDKVLQQISAVRAALYQVGVLYFTDKLTDGIEPIADPKKQIREAIGRISRFS